MYFSGPFGRCHDFENAAPFYYSCVYDLCATSLDQRWLKDSHQSYAKACDEAQRPTDGWRELRPDFGKLPAEKEIIFLC